MHECAHIQTQRRQIIKHSVVGASSLNPFVDSEKQGRQAEASYICGRDMSKGTDTLEQK